MEDDEIFGPIIYKHTAEDAVEDGILIEVGSVGKERVYFTRTLFEKGYEDRGRRIELVNRGLSLLKKCDPEDTDYMQLRVIEKDKIWIICDGQGYTLMEPEDY